MEQRREVLVDIKQPTHYTCKEGGFFHPWPEGRIIKEKCLKKRSITTVLIGVPPTKVHSLAFENPSRLNEKFPRWDCVNGWTKNL